MELALIITLFVISYLLGSIPFGLIIGKKFKGIDLTEHGSKNIGATNAVRVLGFKLGLLVFLGDSFKGALVILIAKLLHFTFVIDLVHIGPYNITVFYGVFAVIGNIFPIFAKFNGGKAVACTVGVILALNPLVALLSAVIFIAVLFLSGYVSLSSVTAAIVCLALSILDIQFAWFTSDASYNTYLFQIIGVSLIVLFLIVKHIPNMKRLLMGTEKSFNVGLRKYYNKKKQKEIDDENKSL